MPIMGDWICSKSYAAKIQPLSKSFEVYYGHAINGHIDRQWIGHKEANVKNLFDTLALLVVLALSFQLCALISVSCRSRDCRGTTHFSSVYRWQTNIMRLLPNDLYANGYHHSGKCWQFINGMEIK